MVQAVKEVVRQVGRVKEKGSFAQNISIVFSGNVLNLILQLVFAPVISRLYGPEAYGEYAYYNLIITNIGFFAAMSLPSVYVLPKTRFEFLALGKIVILGVLVLTGASLLIFFFLNGSLIKFKGAWTALPVIVVLLILNNLNGIFDAWNIRGKRFKRNASVGVSGNLFAKGSTLSVGFFWMSSGLGLLIGDLVKAITIFFTQTSWKIRITVFHFLVKNNWKSVFATFKENINVPKYIFPSQLMSKWTADLPILIIGGYYSKELLGYYTFAMTMLNIPKGLIATALQPVVLQKANDLYTDQKDSFFGFTKGLYPILIITITIPVTLVALLAPSLFKLFFGSQWIQSGDIVQLVSLQYILLIILSPLVSLRRILGLEKRILTLNLISLVFKAFPLIVLFISIPFEKFILAHSLITGGYLFLNFSDLVVSTTRRADSIRIIIFSLACFLSSLSLVMYVSF